MSKARSLSAFISDPAIDASEIGSNAITTDKILDSAVTAGKLATTLDLSSKSITFADNSISGNKIDGGVISNFASTGIDDNASSNLITITSDGKVGIGTSTPSLGKLVVKGTNNYTGAIEIIDNEEPTLYMGTADDNYQTVMFNSYGNFSIKLNQNDATLANKRSSVYPIYYQSGWPDANNAYMDFNVNNATPMTLKANGNVGIGTTNPLVELHVSSSDYPYVRTSATGYTGLDIGQNSDNGEGLIKLRDAQSLTFWTSDTKRASILSTGDVLIGTESGLGVGAKVNMLSAGGNVLHVQSNNSNANNIVSYNSIGGSTFSVHNNGTTTAAGQVISDSFVSRGLGRGTYIGTTWNTIFTISSSSDKTFWAKMRAYSTENGAASHFTFYFSARIRHNGSPYGDFYNFSYSADADLQSASGSAYIQFRFTNNGVTNGDLYFQGYNTTYGGNVYFYEIDAYGYDHIIW